VTDFANVTFSVSTAVYFRDLRYLMLCHS